MCLTSNTSSLALTSALSSIVKIRLPQALDQVLGALRAALKDKSSQALSNQEAQAFEEAYKLCKLQGARSIRECVSSIHSALLRKPSSARQALMGEQELALLEFSDVEDQLLANALASHLRETLAEQELNLCGCFSRMVGQHVANAENPFSLDYLVLHWLKALSLSEGDEAVRHVFFTQMCAVLPASLVAYYTALATAFDRHQITPLLPEPMLPVQQGRDADYRVDSLDSGNAEFKQAEEVAVSPIQRDVLERLLLCPPPAQGWTADSLLKYFESNGFYLSERQREDTHLVSGVFQSLQHEQAMADSLKPALNKLLLPVLDATLREPAAISDKHHPVRATLDRLLSLAELSEPLLEARLEVLIDYLVTHYQGNSLSFSSIDAELDELLEVQQRAYRRSVERVAELYRGQEALLNARRSVSLGLTEVLGARPPKLLLQWLQAGWRDLLVYRFIRADVEDQWRADLELTRLLAEYLLSSSTHRNESERRKRSLEVDHLLSSMGRKLDEFGIANANCKLILETMRQQMLAGREVELGELDTPEIPRSQVPPQLQRWQASLESLEEGDWLENADGQPLQLVWRSSQKDQYVLVDKKGVEVSHLTIAELSELVSEGLLLIAQNDGGDQGIIQRALQGIVGRLYREISHARSHDELTGLLNRRSFEAVVAKSLSSEVRVSYLLAQIDQFSVLNSHLGLVAGDACLKHVAQALQRMLPEQGVLARLDGVEFAAMIPQCDEDRASVLAEKLRAGIENEVFDWQGHSHTVTLSIGIVSNTESHDVACVLSNLYAASNHAKESGRNRVHRFSVPADDERVGLLAIAARIDQIIRCEELSLRVQQIATTDINARQLPHYELLLVMENDLPLEDFIAAAERYNRMAKVDRWVLEQAFSQLEKAPDLWQRCSSISINLSGNSLNDGGLLAFVEELFERYEVAPQRICFEITETTAVANLANVADLVRRLQRLGCSFALDDFGVGFSSFDYLKRLPVDIVKIDGSFVREIAHSSSDLAMVRSINDLAHTLGRVTVAEYVENQQIRELLIDIGVDFVQGYGVQMPRSFVGLLADA
ncbi:DUF1631 family protein [Pseudomonas segetis]